MFVCVYQPCEDGKYRCACGNTSSKPDTVSHPCRAKAKELPDEQPGSVMPDPNRPAGLCLKCQYRGSEVIGSQECATCAGKTRLHIYACAKLGQCVPATVRACSEFQPIVIEAAHKTS